MLFQELIQSFRSLKEIVVESCIEIVNFVGKKREIQHFWAHIDQKMIKASEISTVLPPEISSDVQKVFGLHFYIFGMLTSPKATSVTQIDNALQKKGPFLQCIGPKITFFGVFFREIASNSAPDPPHRRVTTSWSPQGCSDSILIPYITCI